MEYQIPVVARYKDDEAVEEIMLTGFEKLSLGGVVTWRRKSGKDLGIIARKAIVVGRLLLAAFRGSGWWKLKVVLVRKK